MFPSHPAQHIRKAREFLSGTFPVYPDQLYNHSPEQAGKFPAPSLLSRVNADSPGSYHLHNPDREELQLFQTMRLIPTEAKPPDPATCGNSDCPTLSSSCRSMGMASSWQSPCTCACRKTGSSDKAFPQAAKPARPRCSGSRGDAKSTQGGKRMQPLRLPLARGAGETLGSTGEPGTRRGRGCAGVNSGTHTGYIAHTG